jgi:hypothetical protein
VEGPILCLPDSWLLWDVQNFSDINPQNLAILDLLDPPPEVLVVGCGATMKPLPQQLQEFLRARNIAVEMLDTVGRGMWREGGGGGTLCVTAGLGDMAWHAVSSAGLVAPGVVLVGAAFTGKFKLSLCHHTCQPCILFV